MSVLQLVSGVEYKGKLPRKRSYSPPQKKPSVVKVKEVIDVCVLVRGKGYCVGDQFRMVFRFDRSESCWVCKAYSFAFGRKNLFDRFVFVGDVDEGFMKGRELSVQIVGGGFDTFYVSLVQ